MSIKKYIIGVLITATAATGCQKVLDVKPEVALDASTRFKDIKDYQFALLGAYTYFQSTSYYGATDARANAFVSLPDMLSDNLAENPFESLFNERVFSRWRYVTDEDQIERTWLAAYKIIMQANLSMTGIEKFSATKAGQVNRIKAQALAIRALVHFDLLRYWADVYDRNSNVLGVPYITKIDYEAKPSRQTVKQNYDSIEHDLLAAKALMANMDEDINIASDRSFIDSNAVNGLLARIYLYSGQMDNAADHAKRVIDKVPLASMSEFTRIWTDASTEEVLWSLAFDAGQGQPGSNVFAPELNRSQYEPPQSMLDLYDANDIRLNTYFAVVENDDGPRIVVSKYLAKESRLRNPDGVVNFKAIRVAEMYLIRAEANARKAVPNEAAAMADLNKLRAARIPGYVNENLTGTALLDAIELERRKELFMEGHRFFDLKRKGKTIRKVVRTDCTNFCTLDPTRREWTWPIPQAEIDANPNIGLQNPGY